MTNNPWLDALAEAQAAARRLAERAGELEPELTSVERGAADVVAISGWQSKSMESYVLAATRWQEDIAAMCTEVRTLIANLETLPSRVDVSCSA